MSPKPLCVEPFKFLCGSLHFSALLCAQDSFAGHRPTNPTLQGSNPGTYCWLQYLCTGCMLHLLWSLNPLLCAHSYLRIFRSHQQLWIMQNPVVICGFGTDRQRAENLLTDQPVVSTQPPAPLPRSSHLALLSPFDSCLQLRSSMGCIGNICYKPYIAICLSFVCPSDPVSFSLMLTGWYACGVMHMLL